MGRLVDQLRSLLGMGRRGPLAPEPPAHRSEVPPTPRPVTIVAAPSWKVVARCGFGLDSDHLIDSFLIMREEDDGPLFWHGRISELQQWDIDRP